MSNCSDIHFQVNLFQAKTPNIPQFQLLNSDNLVFFLVCGVIVNHSFFIR